MPTPSLLSTGLVCGGATAVLLLARRRARARSKPFRCTLRPATAADVESVARCWAEAYPEQGPDVQGLAPSFLAERTGAHMFRSRALERVADTLVACDRHGEVVGFCVCVGSGDSAEIEQLFLSARARGAGVAAPLLEAGEELLRARGSTHAHLYCMPLNARALHFYERGGWRRRGVRGHEVQISGGRTFTLQLMRLEKPLRPPARLIVLSGGSGVGKTALIERLATLGYATVPEAAMQVSQSVSQYHTPSREPGEHMIRTMTSLSRVKVLYGEYLCTSPSTLVCAGHWRA